MKFRYEYGDEVNVVSGPNIGMRGTIYNIQETGDTVRIHIKTADNEKFIANMDQIVPDTAIFMNKVWTEDYYYRLVGKEGLWKVRNGYLLRLDNSEADIITGHHRMAARINKATYDLFSSHDIPMDGSQFWLFDSSTGCYSGPMHIENDTIRTSANTYVEMKDTYQGMDAKNLMKNLQGLIAYTESTEKKAEEKAEETPSWLPSKDRKGGLPSVNVSLETWKQIFDERRGGMAIEKIAKKHGLTYATVQRYLSKAGVKKAA